MKQVSVTQSIEASPEAAWNILKTGTNLQKWIPIIATCELDGNCAGAKRVCTTPDGKVLKETILLIDNSNHIFKYRIDEQDVMPLNNYVGSVSVLHRKNKTEINWSAEFDLIHEAAWPDVEKGLTDLFKLAIAGLDSLAQSQVVTS